MLQFLFSHVLGELDEIIRAAAQSTVNTDDDGDSSNGGCAQSVLLFHLAFAPCCKADSVCMVMAVHSVSPWCLQASCPCRPHPSWVTVTAMQTESADGRGSCPQVSSWKRFLTHRRFTEKLCPPVFVCLLNYILTWAPVSQEPLKLRTVGRKFSFASVGKFIFLREQIRYIALVSVSKASMPPESETCTFEIHSSFWKPTYEMKDTITPSYKMKLKLEC